MFTCNNRICSYFRKCTIDIVNYVVSGRSLVVTHLLIVTACNSSHYASMYLMKQTLATNLTKFLDRLFQLRSNTKMFQYFLRMGEFNYLLQNNESEMFQLFQQKMSEDKYWDSDHTNCCSIYVTITKR